MFKVIPKTELRSPVGFRMHLEGFGFITEQPDFSDHYRDMFPTEKKATNALHRLLWDLYCTERHVHHLGGAGFEDYYTRRRTSFDPGAYKYLITHILLQLGGVEFLRSQTHIDSPVSKKEIMKKLAPVVKHFEIVPVV